MRSKDRRGSRVQEWEFWLVRMFWVLDSIKELSRQMRITKDRDTKNNFFIILLIVICFFSLLVVSLTFSISLISFISLLDVNMGKFSFELFKNSLLNYFYYFSLINIKRDKTYNIYQLGSKFIQ